MITEVKQCWSQSVFGWVRRKTAFLYTLITFYLHYLFCVSFFHDLLVWSKSKVPTFSLKVLSEILEKVVNSCVFHIWSKWFSLVNFQMFFRSGTSIFIKNNRVNYGPTSYSNITFYRRLSFRNLDKNGLCIFG